MNTHKSSITDGVHAYPLPARVAADLHKDGQGGSAGKKYLIVRDNPGPEENWAEVIEETTNGKE